MSIYNYRGKNNLNTKNKALKTSRICHEMAVLRPATNLFQCCTEISKLKRCVCDINEEMFLCIANPMKI